MDQDKMSSPADPEKVELAITVTPNELKQAVARYDLMLPGEVTAIYTVMLAVPEFGLRVAMALQDAARAVSSGAMPRERVLDAAVVPAFMVGLMVGRGQTTSPVEALAGAAMDAALSPSLEVPDFKRQMEIIE